MQDVSVEIGGKELLKGANLKLIAEQRYGMARVMALVLQPGRRTHMGGAISSPVGHWMFCRCRRTHWSERRRQVHAAPVWLDLLLPSTSPMLIICIYGDG
jgi:hypothetical protein